MCSTIVVEVLNDRVRDGNVCFTLAMDTGKNIKEEKKRKSKPTKSLKKWETKSIVEVRPFINDPFLAEGVIEKNGVKPHGVLVMVS